MGCSSAFDAWRLRLSLGGGWGFLPWGFGFGGIGCLLNLCGKGRG